MCLIGTDSYIQIFIGNGDGWDEARHFDMCSFIFVLSWILPNELPFIERHAMWLEYKFTNFSSSSSFLNPIVAAHTDIVSLAMEIIKS